MEELNRSSDGTDGSHALAAGFKARSGGRSGGGGGHSGGGRGKRDGKGRPLNQRQPQHQPRHQREQQPAQQQHYQQRYQQYQQQEPQQQYQRYQPRHPQQPAQHSGGWGPSRVCFRCDKHGHFLSECRAVPPTRFPDPYKGAQAVTYTYSEDYVNFGSGRPPSQSTPAPPDQHGPPVPSESSWSSFSEEATLAQFAPPGKSPVPN